MNFTDERLFATFAPVSTADWEAKVRADLKGASYEAKLVGHTADGLRIKPYYRREDSDALMQNRKQGLLIPKTGMNVWQIRHNFVVDDVTEAHALILEALQGGVQSLGLYLRASLAEGDWDKLFENVWIEAIPVHFYMDSEALLGGETAKNEALKIAEAYARLAIRKGLNPAELQGSIALNATKPADFPLAAFKTFSIDALTLCNAGATPAQELAFVLAKTSEALVAGLSLTEMTVSLSVGSAYFTEIAKFRAFRLLWGQLCAAYGQTVTPVHLHATSVLNNKTVYDRYTNLLRSTSEAMAAVIGGCDSLALLPFDALTTESGRLGHRMARNIQLILAHEAHLDYVVDPAAGAYFIETMTDELGAKAWQLFQEIEQKGGWAAAQGLVKGWVSAAHHAAKEAVLHGLTPVLGVNTFPNPFETQAQLTVYGEDRLAYPFEGLRAKVDAFSRRPKVALLKFGSGAFASARAIFAGNIMAAAGFETVESPLFASLAVATDWLADEKPDLIVLCSKDDAYAELTKELGASLTDSGTLLLIAGKPEHDDWSAHGASFLLRMNNQHAPISIGVVHENGHIRHEVRMLFETLQTLVAQLSPRLS